MPRELHAHTCGKCGAQWTHSASSPGNWQSKHTCPRCRSWPWTLAERVRPMRRRYYWPPRRRNLGVWVTDPCGQGYCDGNPPYACPQDCPPQTQAQDANSTAAGGTLPATGQPAAGATAPGTTPAAPGTTPAAPAPTTSGFSMANLTNFSTPYPYIAIGGAILLVALLMPGGRKAGSSPAPNVFHYG
jgi:hypothetical protein